MTLHLNNRRKSKRTLVKRIKRRKNRRLSTEQTFCKIEEEGKEIKEKEKENSRVERTYQKTPRRQGRR